jgi:hypothetical protein
MVDAAQRQACQARPSMRAADDDEAHVGRKLERVTQEQKVSNCVDTSLPAIASHDLTRRKPRVRVRVQDPMSQQPLDVAECAHT